MVLLVVVNSDVIFSPTTLVMVTSAGSSVPDVSSSEKVPLFGLGNTSSEVIPVVTGATYAGSHTENERMYTA